MNVNEGLRKVLAADRALREAREALLEQGDNKGLIAAIRGEIDKGFEDESWEAVCRLGCLASILGELQTAESAEQLVRLLGHEHEAVRFSAGDELTAHLESRYAEVARLFEAEVTRAVAEGTSNPGLLEMPHLLVQVPEPGSVKIITAMLKHSDAEVVANAVECLAAIGDPASLPALEALRGDKRMVMLTDDENEEDEGEEHELGELVAEAIDTLRGNDDDDDDDKVS